MIHLIIPFWQDKNRESSIKMLWWRLRIYRGILVEVHIVYRFRRTPTSGKRIAAVVIVIIIIIIIVIAPPIQKLRTKIREVQ